MINIVVDAFSYIKAYACQIGQISGTPQLTALIFEHFILADNGRGATLKMGAAEGSQLFQEIEMEKSHDIFSKNSQIHPEQSNIILRSNKSSAFEIKDLDE
jgi:hypothetical protein